MLLTMPGSYRVALAMGQIHNESKKVYCRPTVANVADAPVHGAVARALGTCRTDGFNQNESANYDPNRPGGHDTCTCTWQSGFCSKLLLSIDIIIIIIIIIK